MRLKLSFVALLIFGLPFYSYLQTESNISMILLENENIASVNINENEFISALKNVSEIVEETFKGIKKSQKIGVLYTAHKVGNPTCELFSNPKVSKSIEKKLIEDIKSKCNINTKLLDFPVFIFLNSSMENIKKDFPDFKSEEVKRNEEYVNASLKAKYELNKLFAQDVLSIFGAFELNAEAQFEGVVNLGELIVKTDFKKDQSVVKFTDENENYWRAMMEMSIGNQLIPATKVFMLASQGEFDYAMKYLEILRFYSDPKSLAAKYLNQLTERITLFEEELTQELKKGIAFHDVGKYKEALAVYNNVLDQYPHSAWTKYEIYFTENERALKNKEIELEDASIWLKAKVGVYEKNPLYSVDVRASNKKEGYLMFRRISISELFRDKEKRKDDLFLYADIAMDLEVYDFAATLYWLSLTFDKRDAALDKMLYCLEKLNIIRLKNNFKGDFEKVFKEIEEKQKEEMMESATYKMFAD
jgi:hypothetical protein